MTRKQSPWKCCFNFRSLSSLMHRRIAWTRVRAPVFCSKKLIFRHPPLFLLTSQISWQSIKVYHFAQRVLRFFHFCLTSESLSSNTVQEMWHVLISIYETKGSIITNKFYLQPRLQVINWKKPHAVSHNCHNYLRKSTMDVDVIQSIRIYAKPKS